MSNNPAELKATGLKATLPRLKILEIFQKNPVRHLSAEDIYRLLLSENLEIGLATVYRVLTQFEQAGILSRNYFETGKAVFELNEGSQSFRMMKSRKDSMKLQTGTVLKSSITRWQFTDAVAV